MATVLVVDDEPHIVRIVAFTLRGAGFQVTTAADGVEALEKSRAARPDLILLDVMMPRLDGFQTLEALRADPETRDIPVMFLTVRGQERDRRRGMELGAADYMTKPFSPGDLLDRVRGVLARRTGTAG